MICMSCGSKRVASVNGKCSDRCIVEIGDKEQDGYVPDDMPFGLGDYLEFRVCLDCGHMNGNWPCPETELERSEQEEEDW